VDESEEDDPWYWFCHDDAWRIVATFRATDTYPKEVFVYHNAGFGGYGGSSYIDSVILRDKEVKAKWSEEATENREERRYYCQNWRADVSALLTDAGSMIEWVKYSSYGVPFALPAGDTDSGGDWDATDSTRITTSSSYDVRQDTNLDGTIGTADVTHANSITGGYQTLGRGILSSSGTANRKGYAGYEYDPTLEGAGKWLYHVRHRVYDADVGRWTRRDPLGYVDGMSLYEYVRSRPWYFRDPHGLSSCSSCSQRSLSSMPGACPQPTPPSDCPPGFYYDPIRDQCVMEDFPSDVAPPVTPVRVCFYDADGGWICKWVADCKGPL
jgi:RHS repeat-associated protein